MPTKYTHELERKVKSKARDRDGKRVGDRDGKRVGDRDGKRVGDRRLRAGKLARVRA